MKKMTSQIFLSAPDAIMEERFPWVCHIFWDGARSYHLEFAAQGGRGVNLPNIE